MGRTNPMNPSSPATRFFEWNGEKGIVRYYDKQAKHNVEVGLNFTFIPLEIMSRVKGFNTGQEASVWSNEVKNISREPLTVKIGNRVIAQGYYSEIKEAVNANGGKFSLSLYIAFKNESDELQIGNIAFSGAALSAWLDFKEQAGEDLWKKAVQIVDCEEGKKGSIVYQTPVFRLKDITPDTDEQAGELQKTVQQWIAQKPGSDEVSGSGGDMASGMDNPGLDNPETDPSEPEKPDNDGLPF